MKMCKVEMLRALLNQRLSAAVEEILVVFERTIAEYEEELSRTKEENERQRKLLDAALKKPQVVLDKYGLFTYSAHFFSIVLFYLHLCGSRGVQTISSEGRIKKSRRRQGPL